MINIPTQMIARIIDKYHVDNVKATLPDFLSAEISRALGIAVTRHEYAQMEQAAEDKLASERKRLQSLREKLQEECPHYSTKYYADGAGGSGDTVCLHCGKEL